MSYQVLARKWRPKSFQELSGQEHVVAVLSNALMQQRLHHAYLFTGTRGVGKTTIARIFAKSLNCQKGITASPCGQCDACIDIDQGRFVDLLEIDAASRTKVDDTREILDNVQYAPTRGRYKVYLIDEVHMLSRSSFNALLKTLEEPPEHVKFILATTDPQKLPITVLSRCLQFHLKALTVQQISAKLSEILTAEKVSIEPLGLSLLAKAARGSMRDCLSLTDQAIAQGQGTITGQNVQQMLGGVDHHWVFKILIALIKQDSAGLMALSLEIASYSPNYGRLMAELLQLLHQIAMNQIVNTHFELTPEHNALVDKFTQAMSPEDVQLYYQIVLNGRKDLPYAYDEQAAFDMVLLRLLAFKPQTAADLVSQNPESQQREVQVTFDDLELDTGLAPDLPEPAALEVTHQNEDESLKNDEQLQQDDIVTTDIPTANHSEETEVLPNIEVAEIAQPQPEEVQQPSNITEQEQPAEVEPLESPISKVLANRNMLRSQKKALESDEKKSNGASERQLEQIEVKPKVVEDLPAIETLPQTPFTEEVIDPATIKKANQVDKWANMIDAMALNGRLRQLALNATISPETNDDKLILCLNQAIKHLISDAAHKQLNTFVSDYFSRPVEVELQVVEQTIADPAQIQHTIDDKRYEYAKQLLRDDPLIKALESSFDAILDEESVQAL
ncbi:DNA polymerase III subunit gamma/tau [Thalassotalea marina]|uniref:DNA polymerase III subunit gamma/tau n=1 Tax=Thalassotalea marina TaxID=1673741 RepID=A0A919BLA1_9GAMM|nr:DNA polymerase III subunit gamma/tau [Thalassotalea marina]GHF98228.1 DNA polymerase III subunit gamma/tau [Thalassotalea marina]